MRVAVLLCALLAMAAIGSAEPVLRWEIPADKLLVDDEAVLSVMLDDTLQVRTLELRVRFDPAVVASVSGEPGELFSGLDLYPGFSLPEDDTWYAYCVVLGADDWAEGPGELFRWTVRGLSAGSSPLTSVEVTMRPPGGADYPDVSLPSRFIDVGDDSITAVPAAVQSSLRIFPNPFNPRASIALEGQGPARLDVLDMRGRLVATPWSGHLDGAPQIVTWEGLDRRGGAVAGGVYLFRLTDARTTTLQKGLLAR